MSAVFRLSRMAKTIASACSVAIPAATSLRVVAEVSKGVLMLCISKIMAE